MEQCARYRAVSFSFALLFSLALLRPISLLCLRAAEDYSALSSCANHGAQEQNQSTRRPAAKCKCVIFHLPRFLIAFAVSRLHSFLCIFTAYAPGGDSNAGSSTWPKDGRHEREGERGGSQSAVRSRDRTRRRAGRSQVSSRPFGSSTQCFSGRHLERVINIVSTKSCCNNITADGSQIRWKAEEEAAGSGDCRPAATRGCHRSRHEGGAAVADAVAPPTAKANRVPDPRPGRVGIV